MSDIAYKLDNRVPASVYVMLGLGLIAMSVSGILVRYAQGAGVPSLAISALRLVISAGLLTPFVIRSYWSDIQKLTLRDMGLAVGAGTFLALHFASWVTSLEYTSVLISVVFVTSSPLWVAILEFVFLKVRLPRLVLVGLVIAIGGGLLIGFGGLGATQTNDVDTGREFIGGALSLAGAMTIAAYLLIARKLQQPRDADDATSKLPIVPYIWLVYGTAGIILLVWALLAGVPITGHSTEGYLWVFAMAIFPQLVGHTSLNYAVGYLPATIVSMVTQLEPVGSAILAYFLFDELPLPLQILGSVVIIAGVMLANFAQRPKKKSELS
ncbi:MAG: DMT family transporter [Chloroflexota bacterium]